MVEHSGCSQPQQLTVNTMATVKFIWPKYLQSFDYDTRRVFTRRMITKGEMDNKYKMVFF